MDYNDSKTKQAVEVVQSFMLISKTLAKYTQRNADSLGLTLQQLGVLNTIYSSPLITLKEITEKLFIPKSTASVSVEELVNLGLVERKSSEEDRRQINLILTDKGKDISKKSIQNPSSYIAMVSALEKIPKEDIDTLIRIHKELSKLL
ncbi:MarR family winged helix-turn-helix transcriptional regulator [Clostridium folliculivorans]|uniref:MarR family transcriptional regulator n=1 Tax=Clostridium folliculivorans TaxID=2886038 RepID=A0A9W5Y053_9CLOT|nr:MarR family transcriptional regulator [Clostridium folliculivorans]GKU24102.1 MarR family transcriptional regulator [Clostridium folliculivorans]GKU30208.1 MarR family transcriptional regulator [Clostridium folliculivorans]